jgi:amino acid transporter
VIKQEALTLASLWNPCIGLRFRKLGILQVFPVILGAGANSRGSGRMRNLQERRRGLFFAAVAVVSVFVSVAGVVVAAIPVADLQR